MQSSQVLIQLTATPISAKNPGVSIDQKQNPNSTFKAALNREVKNQTNGLESKQNVKKNESKEKLESSHAEKNVGATSTVTKASQENESQEELKTTDSVSSTELPVASNQFLHPLEIIRDLQALEQEKKDELTLTDDQHPDGNLASLINVGNVQTSLPTDKVQDLSDETQTMRTTELSLGNQTLRNNNAEKTEASTDNKQDASNMKTIPIDELAVQRPAGPPEAQQVIKNLSENDQKVETAVDTKIAAAPTKASAPTTTTSVKVENNSKLTASLNSALAKVFNTEVPATAVRPQTTEAQDATPAIQVTTPLTMIDTAAKTDSTDTKIQKVDALRIPEAQGNTSISAKIDSASAKQPLDLSPESRSALNISGDVLPVAISKDLTKTTTVVSTQLASESNKTSREPISNLGDEEIVNIDAAKNITVKLSEPNIAPPPANTVKPQSETNVTITPNQASLPNQTIRNGLNLKDSDRDSNTKLGMLETLQNPNIAAIEKKQSDSDSRINNLEKKHDFDSSLKERMANNAMPPVMDETTIANATPSIGETSVARLEDKHIGPRVGSKMWDQAIGQKVIWMVAGGEQSAELSLNPPDLGPLQVVLSISDNFVDASFVSSHLDVREAIEAAAPKLREMMDNAGISLSGFSVSSQSSSSNMNFSNEQNRQSPSSSSRMNKLEVDNSVRVNATPVSRTQLGAVDTFV